MNPPAKDTLHQAVILLRAEGPRAVLSRALDRIAESRRLAALEMLSHADFGTRASRHEVMALNLSPIPPSPRRGGSQIQMLDRLRHERGLRAVALAYPKDGALHVELSGEGTPGRTVVDTGRGIVHDTVHAARLLRAPIVHFENLHGFPLDLVDSVRKQGMSVVLSVHDFTLFCRRPHLIETRTGGFCDYSTDPDRCRRCLEASCQLDGLSQARYRRQSARSLKNADTVIYVSEFLRERHQSLFPDASPRTTLVIPPSTTRSPETVGPVEFVESVAFVGGFSEHKGGALIKPTMDRLRTRAPTLRAHVFGNGDTDLAREIKRSAGIRLHGYYRRGMLPKMLAAHRVKVAVFPSIWPEAYGLVVDECLSAAVPVVAFDHGAVAARLREWNSGRLVPVEDGADGLAEASLECLNSAMTVAPDVIRGLPTPADAARRHVELYRRLLRATPRIGYDDHGGAARD